MDYFASQRIQQLDVPQYMNDFTEKDTQKYNQCLKDNVTNMLLENYKDTY